MHCLYFEQKYHLFITEFNKQIKVYFQTNRLTPEFENIDKIIINMLYKYERGEYTRTAPATYDVYRLTGFDEHLTKRALSKGRFCSYALKKLDQILEHTVHIFCLSINPSYFNKERN